MISWLLILAILCCTFSFHGFPPPLNIVQSGASVLLDQSENGLAAEYGGQSLMQTLGKHCISESDGFSKCLLRVHTCMKLKMPFPTCLSGHLCTCTNSLSNSCSKSPAVIIEGYMTANTWYSCIS